MTQDPETRAELVEERAAIMFEGGVRPKARAEALAAQAHGFADWADFVAKTNLNPKEE